MPHDARPPIHPRPRVRLHPLLAVLFACFAVAGLFLAGVAAQRLGEKQPAAAAGATTAPAGPKSPATPPPPGLGDKVRDGKFEFVVSGLDCSRTTVGGDLIKRTATGKFCLVGLSVRNIADGSRYLLGHSQKAFDAAGTAYGADAIAGVYANRDTKTFLEKLDPGERVSGVLVFDVPKAIRLTTLTLHDSPLSGGVSVTLR